MPGDERGQAHRLRLWLPCFYDVNERRHRSGEELLRGSLIPCLHSPSTVFTLLSSECPFPLRIVFVSVYFSVFIFCLYRYTNSHFSFMCRVSVRNFFFLLYVLSALFNYQLLYIFSSQSSSICVYFLCLLWLHFFILTSCFHLLSSFSRLSLYYHTITNDHRLKVANVILIILGHSVLLFWPSVRPSVCASA